MISLVGALSLKSFVIRAATYATISALYCLELVLSEISCNSTFTKDTAVKKIDYRANVYALLTSSVSFNHGIPTYDVCGKLILERESDTKNRVKIMPPRMITRSAGRPAAESLGGGTSERVSRGGRGKRPREGNDERVDELNGQGNGLGMGANGGVEGANGNVGEANGGAPDFPMIIAQQLRNLLPAMLAQVSNQGNVRNQNGNVVIDTSQQPEMISSYSYI
ncbi:hypothetical protein Tco_0237023 [Tanacetum coccineum]